MRIVFIVLAFASLLSGCVPQKGGAAPAGGPTADKPADLHNSQFARLGRHLRGCPAVPTARHQDA
jgi:hypothetical protein